jgi:hypothetical protein
MRRGLMQSNNMIVCFAELCQRKNQVYMFIDMRRLGLDKLGYEKQTYEREIHPESFNYTTSSPTSVLGRYCRSII